METYEKAVARLEKERDKILYTAGIQVPYNTHFYIGKGGDSYHDFLSCNGNIASWFLNASDTVIWRRHLMGDREGEEEIKPKIDASVTKFEDICADLTSLYERKNHDYGDSFHKSFKRYGMTMARIRLGDKLNRLERLATTNEQKVNDESIKDTLMDLANYAIMTLMELEE